MKIKTINKWLIIKLSIIAFFILLLSGTSNISAAVDHSNEVIINDWQIYDVNDVALSQDNGAIYLNDYQLELTWSLSPLVDTLKENDNFNIPLPVNAQFGTWSSTNSTYENFTDLNGVIIGTWRLNSGKINVVLNANANGLTSITSTFKTGKGALKNNTTNSIIQDVSIGDLAKQIKFYSAPTKPLTINDQKYAAQTSNSKIRWGVTINNAGANELSQKDWGSNFTIRNNTYFEDTMQNGSTAITLNNITGYVIYPTDLVSGIASNQGYTLPVTNKFTKVVQNNNETYNDFKTRLKTLEYGIYKDSNNIQTLIINFGNVGDNNLKYSDIDPDFINKATTAAINSGLYHESDRNELVAYFTKTYGDTNVINGNIARYVVSLFTDYNKVASDTPKNNTANITMNGTTRPFNGTGILQANTGNTVINTSTANLYLFDEDDNTLLGNAMFKLQHLDNGIWSDYTTVSNMNTDVDGHIQTPVLFNGTYRFIQLSPSTAEYDLSSSQGFNSSLGSIISEEFTINNLAPINNIIKVSNVKYKYDVTYDKGTKGLFVNEVYSKVVINTNTPAFTGQLDVDGNPIGEAGYIFNGWSETISDKVTKDVTYTAQWLRIEYPIYYVLDGGINNSQNPTMYYHGDSVLSFNNATKAGYKFLGWYDADLNGLPITQISDTETGPKTLYAYWEKINDTTPVVEVIVDKNDKVKDKNQVEMIAVTGSDLRLKALLILISFSTIALFISRKIKRDKIK